MLITEKEKTVAIVTQYGWHTVSYAFSEDIVAYFPPYLLRLFIFIFIITEKIRLVKLYFIMKYLFDKISKIPL
jgi:hypothetical protein